MWRMRVQKNSWGGGLDDFGTEIVKGLNANEQVIRHPSNDIDDGRRVRIAR